MGTKNKPGQFDCYDAAADDEPMFVLLARDADAADTVETWARRRFERLARSLSDWHASERCEHDLRIDRGLRKIAEALQCATAMREWKRPKPESITPEPLAQPARPECVAPFCGCKSSWNCPRERYDARVYSPPFTAADLRGMGE
jgi:hypothetical protein